MIYRGTLNLDFTGPTTNAQTRLSLALREAGWVHVETSAFVRDNANITEMWLGIGLVAKYAATVGTISALTFHIQGAETDFVTNTSLASTQSGANALADIQRLTFPG